MPVGGGARSLHRGGRTSRRRRRVRPSLGRRGTARREPPPPPCPSPLLLFLWGVPAGVGHASGPVRVRTVNKRRREEQKNERQSRASPSQLRGNRRADGRAGAPPAARTSGGRWPPAVATAVACRGAPVDTRGRQLCTVCTYLSDRRGWAVIAAPRFHALWIRPPVPSGCKGSVDCRVPSSPAPDVCNATQFGGGRSA